MSRIIRKKFPNDSILSEEGSNVANDSNRRWIIDPIDGTKAFIHGIPTFGNMIALEINGEVCIGAINVPALNLLFYGQKGQGAFANGKRIHVSKESKLDKCSILHGRGKGFLEKGYLRKLRNLLDAVYHSWGFSDPFAFYLVATGRIDALVETFPKPWDVAAPKIILEEAGGRFSDLNGGQSLSSNNIAIFSNGKIHEQLINILKK
jgi:fructose-1,6-bisphosphatase/inositol monophosphatase family enzyme